jgi:hypothetical protein
MNITNEQTLVHMLIISEFLRREKISIGLLAPKDCV